VRKHITEKSKTKTRKKPKKRMKKIIKKNRMEKTALTSNS
jgi:hypothetical protein